MTKRFFRGLIGAIGFVLVAFRVEAADVTGVVVPANPLPLGVTVSGMIDRVNVRTGDTVRRGDPILVVEEARAQAQLKAATAKVASLRADWAEARKERDRAVEMYERTVLSDHDLQLAKVAFARADAELQQARAGEAKANSVLRNSRLSAPIDGVIINVAAVPGQAVVNRSRMTPLVWLSPATSKRVRLDNVSDMTGSTVPEPGSMVRIRADGKAFDAVMLPRNNGGGPEIRAVYAMPVGEVAGSLKTGQSVSVSW